MEIVLNRLTKVFVTKNKQETRAVDNLDIVIPSGKLVGLLGPSGCGKTTTLFMIAGLHKPTSGRILFGNEDVTKLTADKRGIGLVFQNYALYPHMTVRQNIMFPLENLKVDYDEAVARVHEMAKLVGIEDQLDKKPGELSGGQQQRVAIARALVKKPRVLLLDEPLSNLDARLRLQTREEIKRIQRETGITTIFVTHDQEEAMSISDEIVVMEKGVLQQRDKPQEVYYNPENLFVAKFLGSPAINVLRGEIKQNKLYINGEYFADKKAKDGQYEVGMRPENFKVSESGVSVKVVDVDIIGRDTIIRFQLGDQTARALVDSETVESIKNIKLAIKDEKILLFDIETGKVVKTK
ncbi:ABC transporter ATP-binding protein [Acholeplasma vituli]|uniref:ABC transporter ATP-binding protein n=1 Tax=Paracholeplasma vituli TaxID=69473 RepID=A0ABT2PTD7_9MOLU|nr:ABC transporter ATP-binding protein [Paracholeplasma vituli]MCU0104218.1 ABC transporter ATP-binding protein [Paracholeplasma vituli]